MTDEQHYRGPTLATTLDPDAFLRVADLTVRYRRAGVEVPVVDDVSFSVARGERVALVGESGSGKSTIGNAVMGFVERMGGTVDPTSQILVDGKNAVHFSERERRGYRGNRIAMVFQDPLSALNPVQTVGKQLMEAALLHVPDLSRATARRNAIEVLGDVGIPDPKTRIDAYPHEFSGGMRQRAMIAISLAANPELLIADEPVTALDVTLKRRLLDLFYKLADDRGLAILMVTHDMGAVASFSDRTIVLYSGRIAEAAGTRALFANPRHPYTAQLIRSVPRIDAPLGREIHGISGTPPVPEHRPTGCAFHPRCNWSDGNICVSDSPLKANGMGSQAAASCHFADTLPPLIESMGHSDALGLLTNSVAGDVIEMPILEANSISKSYASGPKKLFRARERSFAVNDVSFRLGRGESVGIVGESGSGKSTLIRCLTRLIEPDAGSIRIASRELRDLTASELRIARRNFQVVFQDPYSSLDPRFTVRKSLAEPLRIHEGIHRRRDAEPRILSTLEMVGLHRTDADRLPHQLSGGQRQRVALARAMMTNPDLLFLDEPVSSLDVSMQAGIINLLRKIQRQQGTSIVIVSHDLALVRLLCDRVVVMNRGTVVEEGRPDEVVKHPKAQYTQSLVESDFVPDPVLEGERRATAAGSTL